MMFYTKTTAMNLIFLTLHKHQAAMPLRWEKKEDWSIITT